MNKNFSISGVVMKWVYFFLLLHRARLVASNSIETSWTREYHQLVQELCFDDGLFKAFFCLDNVLSIVATNYRKSVQMKVFALSWHFFAFGGVRVYSRKTRGAVNKTLPSHWKQLQNAAPGCYKCTMYDWGLSYLIKKLCRDIQEIFSWD